MELNIGVKSIVILFSILLTGIYIWVLYRVALRKRLSVKSDFAKIFPVLITVMAAMLSLTFFFIQSKEKSILFPIKNTTDNKEIIERLDTKVQKLEADIKNIETLVNSGKAVNIDAPDVSVYQQRIESLKQSIADNSVAIEKYNELLLTKPEQLITLPLLQKDIKVIINPVNKYLKFYQ